MYVIAGASVGKASEMVQRRHMGGSAGVLPTKLGDTVDPEELPGDVVESD